MKNLSVIIIAYNEEKNIANAIQSALIISDDIVVVDSFSNDRTSEIASQLGARVIQQKFLGYAEQKNFAAEHAKNDFVLSLDADEVISEQLAQSIENIELSETKVYSFNRLTNYCGRFIYHCGWYPDLKIRIYHKHSVKWGGESIHEILLVNNHQEIVHLKGDLLHYSYYTFNDHLKQLDKFTSLQAEELFKKGVHPNLYHYIIKPHFKFTRDYIFKLGFLDGWEGFNISLISAIGVYLKYQKLRMLIKKNAQ